MRRSAPPNQHEFFFSYLLPVPGIYQGYTCYTSNDNRHNASHETRRPDTKHTYFPKITARNQLYYLAKLIYSRRLGGIEQPTHSPDESDVVAPGVTQAAIAHKNSSVAPRGSKQCTALTPVDHLRGLRSVAPRTACRWRTVNYCQWSYTDVHCSLWSAWRIMGPLYNLRCDTFDFSEVSVQSRTRKHAHP